MQKGLFLRWIQEPVEKKFKLIILHHSFCGRTILTPFYRPFKTFSRIWCTYNHFALLPSSNIEKTGYILDLKPSLKIKIVNIKESIFNFLIIQYYIYFLNIFFVADNENQKNWPAGIYSTRTLLSVINKGGTMPYSS